jgi:hypothetical protein
MNEPIGGCTPIDRPTDLTAQRNGLMRSVSTDNGIYDDHGLTAPTATHQNCGWRWPHVELATPWW